jgi:hypothetical protein
MIIAQYLPQWLRSRLQKPVPQNRPILSKQDHQVLPTLPRSERPAVVRPGDGESPAGIRALWHIRF